MVGSATICMHNGSKLDLGGSGLLLPVVLKESATIGNGRLNGALAVNEGKTLILCGDLDGNNTITLGDGATLDLARHALSKTVELTGQSCKIGSGTIKSDLILADNASFTWSDEYLARLYRQPAARSSGCRLSRSV